MKSHPQPANEHKTNGGGGGQELQVRDSPCENNQEEERREKNQIKSRTGLPAPLNSNPDCASSLGSYLSHPITPRELGSEIGPPFLFDFTGSEPEALRLT